VKLYRRVTSLICVNGLGKHTRPVEKGGWGGSWKGELCKIDFTAWEPVRKKKEGGWKSYGYEKGREEEGKEIQEAGDL